MSRTDSSCTKLIEPKLWTCPKCTVDVTESYYLCPMCGHECEEFQFVNAGSHMKDADKRARFRSVFKKDKVALPVIHVLSLDQLILNMEIVTRCYKMVLLTSTVVDWSKKVL
jgi:predicted amidophosphoribosyltransferase